MPEVFRLSEADLYPLAQHASRWKRDHPLFKDKPVNSSTVFENLKELWFNGTLDGVIAVDAGAVGALLTVTSPDIFLSVTRMYEAFFYVHPFYRDYSTAVRMMQGVKDIAIQDPDVTELRFGITSGYKEDRIHKLYTRFGFQKQGGVYTMEV